MSQTIETEATNVQLVKKASIDLHVDAVPGYPADLHQFPENYTITLPADRLRSVEDVAKSLLG